MNVVCEQENCHAELVSASYRLQMSTFVFGQIPKRVRNDKNQLTTHNSQLTIHYLHLGLASVTVVPFGHVPLLSVNFKTTR